MNNTEDLELENNKHKYSFQKSLQEYEYERRFKQKTKRIGIS